MILERPATSTGGFVYDRRYINLVTTVTALGGLLYGYDLANISGTIHFFSKHFELDEFSTGWAVGCISVGAAFGAMISGKLSDLWGRRRLLLAAAVLFAITGIGTGWAGTFTSFIVFRLLSGVAVGCATVISPIYIAEISPAAFRGRMVTFYQLAITLGILLAYFTNYLLLGTGVDNWRWMFSSQSAPAILFLLGLFFVSESPRWLISKNREKEAVQILSRIGGPQFAQTEVQAIVNSFSGKSRQPVKALFGKNVVHIVIMGVAIAVFSQIGGPFTAYAPEIFKAAGMAEDSAFLQSIIIGLILFLFTIVAIATIEKVGRRALLLWGVALLLIGALLTALAFHFQVPGIWILILALFSTGVYAATVGPVSWVVLSEIFPNRIRGNAMALATLSLWVTNFLNISSFPVIKSHFGMSMTFGIYVPFFLIFLLFVYFRVPETKGKSLEEIEKILTRNN